MNQSKAYLLAIDVGTSSLKAVIYDRAGRVISSATQRYGYSVSNLGWVEGNPALWWQALCTSIEELHKADIDLPRRSGSSPYRTNAHSCAIGQEF